MTIAIDENLIQDIKNLIVRYCRPDNFDDAVQEALIRAWQLSESNYSRDKILAKAVDRGRAVINPFAGPVPLGKPAKSKEGYRDAEGNISRQKIKDFQDNFKEVHERLPTVTEISRGLGMSTRNVRDHLSRLKTDRKSILVTDNNRVLEPLHASLEVLNEDDEIVSDTVQFEDELLAWLNFVDLVSILNPRDKELMYFSHVEGMRNAEVARCLGKSDSTVRDLINRAHHSLRSHILAVRHP